MKYKYTSFLSAKKVRRNLLTCDLIWKILARGTQWYKWFAIRMNGSKIFRFEILNPRKHVQHPTIPTSMKNLTKTPT